MTHAETPKFDVPLDPEPRQPAPPMPGERDDEIRARHAKELRERDATPPPGFDPELTRTMLERARRGDFTMPDDEAGDKAA